MKILFLTWGERVSESGLYRSQVLNLCHQLAENGAEVDLCSFIPLGNRDFYKFKTRYFKKLNDICTGAKGLGIRLELNHYLGSSFENYTPWYLWFFIYAPWNLIRLEKIILNGNYDIIHCRSYHSAYAAIKVLKKLNLKTPVIFDPRGLMPEEGILHGRYTMNSLSYKRWKVVENFLCNAAPVTIAVSSPMKTYYENLGSKDVRLVYISSDMLDTNLGAPFLLNLSVSNLPASKQLIYIGAVGSWHPVESVFDVFNSFRAINPGATLRILTDKSSWTRIRSVAADKGIDPASYSLAYVSDRKAMQDEIANSFAGLLTYRIPLNYTENIIAKTILSTKFVEYLTAGIPVIANELCGGAAEYILSHGCGVVYDPNKIKEINFTALNDFWIGRENKIKITSEAIHDFSVKENACRYISIYSELVERRKIDSISSVGCDE